MNIDKQLNTLFLRVFRHIPCRGRLCFITGVNAPFYDSLVTYLLPSLSQYAPEAEVVVWDLGLTEEQRNKFVNIQWGGVKMCKFNYEQYPAFFDINKCGGQYAWKSVCVQQTMQQVEADYYVWFDSGNKLLHTPNALKWYLRWYGFYSPYSASTISALTYPGTLAYYRLSDIDKRSMLNGAAIGFYAHSVFACEIMAEWVDGSSKEEVIAPAGSDKSNHRQDQSVLSCVYYSKKKSVPRIGRRYLDFIVHCNKKPH